MSFPVRYLLIYWSWFGIAWMISGLYQLCWQACLPSCSVDHPDGALHNKWVAGAELTCIFAANMGAHVLELEMRREGGV